MMILTGKVRNVLLYSADVPSLGRFWSALLEQPITADGVVDVKITLCADTDLVFVPARGPKRGKNRMHLDLASTSTEHQAMLVKRAHELGAVPVNIGQGAVPWVVLADPEGNELCVLEPRQEYSGIGPVAAVVVDALNPRALARFWSHATGLSVTREHPEYASLRQDSCFWLEFVRTEDPKTATNRMRLDVALGADGDLPTEVARLVAHGAMRSDQGQGDAESVVLTDPEGNEFCIILPQH